MGTIAVAVGVTLIVLGAALAWRPIATENEPAPLPEATFSVAKPTPKPTDEVGPVTPSTMDRNRLLIPAIGVYAPVVDTDVSAGMLTIPDADAVGRYRHGGSVSAGEGTLLLAGHVSSYGRPGALKWLSRLHAGDWVHVTDAVGNRVDAVVTGMDVQLKADLPSDLFTAEGERRIVLVTCGGGIETRPDGSRHYESNVIVTASPLVENGDGSFYPPTDR